MQHDYRQSPSGENVDRFNDWLQSETTAALARDYGNGEATKASIYLFVNRAFESHMPETRIAEMFGKCCVRAGYSDADLESALAWFESFAEIARGIHAGT